MIPLPRHTQAFLLGHAAPLAALALTLAGSLARRPKSAGDEGAAVGAMAVLVGWATIAGFGRLPQSLWTMRLGIGLLLAPAAVALGVRLLLAWRWPHRRRVLLGIEGCFASWWVAQGVDRVAFWRVWLAIGVLIWLASRLGRQDPMRGLALSASLWAGLAAAGAPQGWQTAALTATAGCGGFVLAGVSACVPEACLVALLAAADLSAGRLLRLHANAVDCACLGALAAPIVAGWLAQRYGAKGDRLLAGLAALTPALALGAVIWAVN